MSPTPQASTAEPTGKWLLLQSAWMLPAFVPSGQAVWLAYALLPVVTKSKRSLLCFPVFLVLTWLTGPATFGAYAPLALGVVWVFGMLLALVLNPGVLRQAWASTQAARGDAESLRALRQSSDRHAEPNWSRARQADEPGAARQAQLGAVAAVLGAAVAARTAAGDPPAGGRAATAAMSSASGAPASVTEPGPAADGSGVGPVANAAAPSAWMIAATAAIASAEAREQGKHSADAVPSPLFPWQQPQSAASSDADPGAAEPSATSDAAPPAPAAPPTASEYGPGISVIPQTKIYDPDAGS